ncbi:hypothetical protein [Vibrio barjaei]|jgi:hypothetical protein|uniref:hypothetical protein n=1 Tax=Vibrio barjaei TaxID=1676683 RepID=UPI0007BC3A8C|nr:hypothetical protein [Vibrio barjaei]OIN25691.1 hypothetical protein AWH66_2015560 [Vibrio barjaei]
MKKLIIIVFLVSTLLGCASERYFGGNGAEAITYQEHHNFDFAIKNYDETAKQISALVKDIESTDKEATYVIDYKDTRSKKMLEKIFDQYPSHKVAPQRVEFKHVRTMRSDLKIQVALTRLKTQYCAPAQIQHQIGQPDCFVESMRLKQVSYKSRLVGE